MYRIELHCHMKESSGCSTVPAAEMVSFYKADGYHGIVTTDHFCGSRGDADKWNEHVDRFLRGYRAAKAAGDACGLAVYLGAEIRFPQNSNDYLLMGLTEKFLYDHPYCYASSLSEFYEVARKNGILVVQAHPFRNGCEPADPRYLDGAERHNGHVGHHNHNDLAAAFVDENRLIGTVGSDCHYPHAVGTTAVCVADLPADTKTLAHLLKTGDFMCEICPKDPA